jgi:hypothetical protein
MPTVTNTIAGAGSGVNVLIQIYTATVAPGFTNTQEIGPPVEAITDATGTWSATLTANSLITPANTYYLVTERQTLPRFFAQYAIVVPDGAGPFTAGSIVVSPTVTPSAAAITGVQVAVAGSVAGERPEVNFIDGANVTVTAVDNPTSNRVDVTVAAAGDVPSSRTISTTAPLTGGGDLSANRTLAVSNATGSTVGVVELAGDLGGTATAPTVVGTHLAAPLPIAQGGTGATTQNFVDLTTGQTVAGVKAFTSSPTVPTPTTSTQAANKAYADSAVTAAAGTTVQTETSYGQSSAVGVDTTFAREDHTHGTPSLTAATPSAEPIGASAVVGTATTPARADHVHATPAAGTPDNSAVGDTAAAGVATTVARSDHQHGRESFGTVTAEQTFGASSSNGSATTVARSDHGHGNPTHLSADHSAVVLSALAAPTADVTFNTHSALAIGGKNGIGVVNLVGLKASLGPPTSGTWATGDAFIDSGSALWVCSAGGTPGTWVVPNIDIEDPGTLIVSRSALNASGSDLFNFQIGGVRTGYANEGGELRSRAFNATRVAFRCQSNVAGNGTSVHILEVTLSDNTVMFYVTALGDAGTTRDLAVGRNLAVTGTASAAGVTSTAGITSSGAAIDAGSQKVTSVATPTTTTDAATKAYVDSGAYSTLTDVALLGTNVAQGTPHFQSRAEPGGVTRLQGQLSFTGSITGSSTPGSGATLATLPAGQRPAGFVTFTERFLGTGAAAAVWFVDPSGNLSCSANLVTGNTVNFDGLTFVHA